MGRFSLSVVLAALLCVTFPIMERSASGARGDEHVRQRALLAPMSVLAGTVSLFDRQRARGIAVQGELAYIGVGPRLVVLDVANPLSPSVVGESALLRGEPYRIVVQGRYAYLAAGAGGLLVVDVVDPGNPREVGVYQTQFPAWGLVLEGRHVYLAAGDLHIVDVADPARPVPVGFFEGKPPPEADPASPYTQHYAHDFSSVAVRAGFAYPRGRGTMQVVDVRDPRNPRLAGTYSVRANSFVPGPSNIALTGSYSYMVNLAGPSVGIQIVDVSAPATPMLVRFLRGAGALAIDGDLAYVANPRGFIIIDVARPGDPQFVVEAPAVLPFDVTLWGGDMVIAQSRAYVTAYNGLCVYDLVDRLTPAELGCYYAGPPWLLVRAPAPVLSATDDPLRTAQPGEWYRIYREETAWPPAVRARWALAVREGDAPDQLVWIQLDDRVQMIPR